MKTVKYKKLDGTDLIVEYDENAPCICCGEPVIEASMGGTNLCPWCDTGRCRFCGISIMVFKEEVDGGQSKRDLLAHMTWHKKQLNDKQPLQNPEVVRLSSVETLGNVK